MKQLFVLGMFLFAASHFASAQQSDRVQILPGVAAIHVDKALAKKTDEICALIASSFVIGRGPIGLGVFTAIECVDSITKARQEKERFPWILSVVREGEDEFVTRIFYQKVSSTNPLVQLRTRRYRDLDLTVKSQKFQDIFAVRAVLQLPIWGAARKRDVTSEPEWRSAEFSTSIESLISPSGENVNVYALSYSLRGKFWRTFSLGELKDWKPGGHESTDGWVWYGSGEELSSEVGQQLEKEYDALVFPPLKEVPREKYVLRWRDHGLIGVRAGKQVLMGDSLTDQLYLGEVFMESGPPLGLVANAQYVPKVDLPEELKSISIMSFTLGKSFSLGFPAYRVPRIQLTPHVGVHRLQLTLPIDDLDLSRGVVDYGQDKVISWGGAASASILLSQSVWARPFYSYSLGGKGFSVREATARIWYSGIDLFWLWRLAPPTFAIHGFYEYQSVKFMKVTTEQFDNSEISLGLGFVGLGASYLW